MNRTRSLFVLPLAAALLAGQPPTAATAPVVPKVDSYTFSGLGNGVTYTAYGAQLFGRIAGGFGATVGVESALRARGVAAGANLRFALSYER